MNFTEESNEIRFPMLTVLGIETLSLKKTMPYHKFERLLGAYLSEPDLSEAERVDLLFIKEKVDNLK